jgi:transcription-repair coupling factor (superfamily II helicase)
VEPVILEHLDKSVSALLEKVNNNGNFNGIEGQIYYYYEEEDIVSIMDYFDEPIIYLDEPARIKQRLTTIKTEFDESMKNRLEKGYLLPSQMKVYHQPSHILKFIENSTAILMSTLYQNENLLPFKVRHEVLSKSVNAYNPNFELWIKDLKYYIGKDYKILFLTGSRTRAKRLVELLLEHDVSAFYIENETVPLVPGKLAILK